METQIAAMLENRKESENLLCLEKERRRLGRDKLVFVGMADVAEYYWCAMKSFYKSREMELAFFSSYLQDRILYSFRLGLADKLPKSKESFLEIGDNISSSDIERLLKENAGRIPSQRSVTLSAIETVDENGNPIMLINPSLSQEEIRDSEKQAESQGIRVVSLREAPPKLRGSFLDRIKAERYPTIRWNFAWGNYVVVGVPDGITGEFVYEFKTTRNRFLMGYLKPVALMQADLYGYFFKRPRKRTQIYIVEEDLTETWDNEVDMSKAESVLTEFEKIEEGLAPRPPKAWKCKPCEFREMCSTRPS